MQIIRHLPPEYFYSLHTWCREWKEVQKYGQIVKRERRNRWSDTSSLPQELCHVEFVHLKSMLLVDDCSPYAELRMFHGRLFLSSHYGQVKEVNTTRSVRELENGQRFEDEEAPRVEEKPMTVHSKHSIFMVYTVDENGTLYYCDAYYDSSVFRMRYIIENTDDGFEKVLDMHISQLLSCGTKLYACTNEQIVVWDGDKPVQTINLSPAVRMMAIEGNLMYLISNERKEYMIIDTNTKEILCVPLLSIIISRDICDICVKDGNVYLYSEDNDRHQATLTRHTPNGEQDSLSIDLGPYDRRGYTMNMGITGHYLYVTTTKRTLIIVDLRGFSLKHIDSLTIYSAVIGEDSSLYVNCSDSTSIWPDSSRVLKFYW